MKAGKSSATAMVLPSFATYCLVVSNVASSVAMPRMSSTSSINGTGFMKWMPMKRSGRSVEDASRVIEMEDVLLPMMASGLSRGQTLAKIVRLISSFSVAASMMRSQSPKASNVSAGVMRLSAAWRSSSVMRLRLTCRAMLPERAFGRSLTSIMFFRLFYADPERDSTGPRSHMPRWSTAELAEFRRQFRQRLVKIGNESIVGDLEDRRLFVLVDGHDDFRILHAGEMLDRA